MTALDDRQDASSDVDSAAALAALVVDGEDERRREEPEPGPLADRELLGESDLTLRDVLSRGGVSTLAVLGTLNFFDTFDAAAFQVLGPDIQRSLGLSDTGLGAIAGVGSILLVLSAVPLGYAADRVRRTWLAGGCAFVAAVFTILTGAVQAVWQLVVVRLLVGTGKAATGPVHNALLADTYPIAGRARVFGAHQLTGPLAALLGPLLAGTIAAVAGGSEGWRWVFVAVALPLAAASLLTIRLREPRRGAGEQEAVLGAQLPGTEDVPPSLSAAVQRLLRIRSLYYLLTGVGVLGFAIVGVPTFFNVLLEDAYGLGALERGAVGSLTEIGSLVGILVGGSYGDRVFRASPPRAVLLVAASVATFGVVLTVALYLPNLPLVLLGVGLANVAIFAAVVPLYGFIAAVVPFTLRALGFALVGIFIFLFGGFFGGVLIGSLSDSIGTRGALTVVAAPSALVAAGLIAYGAQFIRRDISVVVEELREEQAERERAATADAETPLLQVRNLDFSYGQVQVLFDVALDVRDGEVLALLGTNGAGKSTLLRAVSGLSQPTRGVIRLGGRTMTYAEPEARVALGVVQVPGGKAVFPSLTVGENLVAGAYAFKWDTERVRARSEQVLELFPKLRERLGQPAGTLSGGEQQMLALAKALLLEPRILLIDELSLGLAPVVVQELLEIVQRLKEEGVTMVIVEQSVNVALSIADRAVFMEKGRVRFEGPAQELAERDDLVRAVFLGAGG